MDRREFDFDIDFEKEFGIDPKDLEGPEYEGELDEDFLTGDGQLGFDLNDPIFDEMPQTPPPAAPIPQEAPVEDDFSLEGLDLGDGDMDDVVLDDMNLDTLGFTYGDEPQADPLPEVDLPADDLASFQDQLPPEDDFSMDDFPVDDFPGDDFPGDDSFPPEDFTSPDDSLPPEDDGNMESMPPLETEDPGDEPPQDDQPRRRRETRKEKRQRIRKFKEEKLPRIIAAVAAGFILFFALGAIIRGIVNKAADDKAQAGANESAQSAAQQLDAEAQRLLEEAAVLAAGYDYEGAIAKLDSFSGEMSAYSEMVSKRSAYNQALSQLVAWSDPSKVPNLSFHVLIADPGRAFTNASLGKKYNQNFVTIDEFAKILQQLYDNGYVLVSMSDIFTETTSESGVTSYSANTIYLPSDKKPIMITETLVNYLAYMIDSDNDGEADKGGAGFASRLVVQNGEIKAELVTSTGETIVGDYDLVPILNSFIKEHPDFSYRGARAMLAVCGHEGVFGYRTNKSVIDIKGQAYYDQQVAGAKEVVAALKADGYEIACYTYENIPYGASDATKIKNDLTKWSEEVKPILGDVNVLIFAQNSEIEDYTGSKYNVVYSSGFRYFINSANSPWTEISTNYVRQSRLMVTGTNMAYYANMFSSYFNAMAVLNSARGTVPT